MLIVSLSDGASSASHSINIDRETQAQRKRVVSGVVVTDRLFLHRRVVSITDSIRSIRAEKRRHRATAWVTLQCDHLSRQQSAATAVAAAATAAAAAVSTSTSANA